MAKTIDARGLSCPQRVLMALEEIKSGKADEILVVGDRDASKENVSRAAVRRGWTVADIDERRCAQPEDPEVTWLFGFLESQTVAGRAPVVTGSHSGGG